MHKRVLIALDLEGVNNVVGEPYSGLKVGTAEWEKARRQAAFEINEAADALFAAGARRVAVWDNHGGGPNLDPADIDTRVELLAPDKALPRMYFADEFDCVCYFGYHAMEGTLGGVLAHTMNSAMLQYYKLDGKYIGEIDMDSYIAASHGMPARFFAGGDLSCQQAKRSIGDIVTVQTKTELGRNKAIFRDNEELLSEIRTRIVEAVSNEVAPISLDFPVVMEKSFKRMEDAARYFSKLEGFGITPAYLEDEILGWDAHTVFATASNMDEFIKCI